MPHYRNCCVCIPPTQHPWHSELNESTNQTNKQMHTLLKTRVQLLADYAQMGQN